MSAIITERIKKLMIQNLYDDITDSANNYYIAIGRSQDWDSAMLLLHQYQQSEKFAILD